MGMVSSKSKLATEHRTATEAGFHRCWYPVALARDLPPGSVIGRDFLGTRVVAYRDAAGQPVVQSAWCPHLGADLSVGQIVDGRLRCPYHHWSFDAQGACANIPTGDKIPPSARIFTYPTEEAWGLVWAFNGECADFAVPRIPGAGASMPEQLEVEAGGIEFRVESPYHLQHGRISGTNTFAQHLRIGGNDMFMLFSGAPIEPGSSSGYFVIGVPQGSAEKLPAVATMVERLNAEDTPVLSTMRFRRGLLTASDRHLATYFRYVDAFPCFAPTEQ